MVGNINKSTTHHNISQCFVICFEVRYFINFSLLVAYIHDESLTHVDFSAVYSLDNTKQFLSSIF